MIASLVILLLLIVAIAVLTRLAPKRELAVDCYGSDASFLEGFSLQSYRPMLRLASQMDRKYLVGAHSDPLARCYRKIQRGLLREYLHDAAADFKRLYAIANGQSVRAASDPGDLSMALFEHQMQFILLTWGIEARLVLDGILPFAMDLGPMMQAIEGLALQTRQLARPQHSYTAA